MTPITRQLGIQYPVILGAMRQITLAEMAAAVSESGGLGQIASSGLSAERLKAEIQKTMQLTDRPFGINIPLHRPNAHEFLEIAGEMGVTTITTSGGNPARLMQRAKELRITVLHKVSNTAMGRKAESAGVDGVIATGFEAGGHGGKDQITTFCLVPQLVDTLSIPVIASGGVSDGRTMAAAFALGAEGVEVGTRFLASFECPIGDYYKEAIVRTTGNGTAPLGHGAMNIRVLKNQAVEKLLNPETEGQQKVKAVDYISPEGDGDTSIMPAGMGAGMIRELFSIKNIMEDMLVGASEMSAKLRQIFEGENFDGF